MKTTTQFQKKIKRACDVRFNNSFLGVVVFSLLMCSLLFCGVVMPKRCYNREIKEASEFTCGICNATFKTLLSFVGHFRAHRMTSKNYYDQFYRTEKDGICKVCGKQTKYATLSTGYRPICSKKCGSLNWAYCNQQANIGKKQSAETKRKRSQTLMGHRLSEATKKKIGDANRGKKMSAEACKAIAEGHKGKPQVLKVESNHQKRRSREESRP